MTATILPASQRVFDAQVANAGGDLDSHDGHSGFDTHWQTAVVVPTINPASQLLRVTRSSRAGGVPDSHDGHGHPDTQKIHAVVVPTSPSATRRPTPRAKALAGTQAGTGHRSTDAQSASAGAVAGPPATRPPTPIFAALADPLLALLADTLDDLERTRIANENRLRQLTRAMTDKDGKERGFGLTLDQPQVASLAGMVEALGRLEHEATLNLGRRIRKHPLGPWVKRTVGVGEKQGARLLAAVGDPYWNTLHGRPRTVSELWAYCGLHVLPATQTTRDAQGCSAGGDPSGDTSGQVGPDAQSTRVAGVAARRRKGVRSNWSPTAKMRAYLVATSCMKQAASPYRAVYDARRAHTTITHPDWTAGHSHNDALRIVSKAILRDLWREARRLHDPPASQNLPDAHASGAGGDLSGDTGGHGEDDARECLAAGVARKETP